MTTYQPNDQVGIYDEPEDATQVHRSVSYSDGSYDRSAPADDGFSPARQRERFGGVHWGAGFFGWLIVVSTTVLLSGIVAATAATLGWADEVTGIDASGEPTTVGLAAAGTVFGVLLLAHYVGGYVAGRMSRFDGGRQGVAVWITGLLLAAAATGVVLLYGSQFPLLSDLDLPRSVPPEATDPVGAVTAAALALSTLLAAVAGGKVGCAYHRKVDDAGWG